VFDIKLCNFVENYETDMTITEQMKESGYQFVPDPMRYSGYYYKEIKDKSGIRYNILCNDKNEFEAGLVYKNKQTFTVNLQAADFGDNLNKIHRFIDGIWKAAKCDYHVKYFSSKTKYRQRDIEDQIEEEKNAQK
jgi:hypothetical protein